jgi:transmembrane sensor
MMKNKNYIDWALIRKAIDNKLSGPEQELFDTWLKSDHAKADFVNKARKYYDGISQSVDHYREEYDHTEAFREFSRYTMKKRSINVRLIGIAASVLLVLSLSAYFFFAPPDHIEKNYSDVHIAPGGSKASLTLSNGEKIFIGKSDTLMQVDQLQSIIEIDSTGLKYVQKTSDQKETMAMNVLEVPHGGEFNLTLSDGTRVWLNAESRLEYPVKFTGKHREITLSGEAFFEVAPNRQMPFIVHTEKINVEVLGTAFNISAYSDEQFQVLTLNHGSVEISGIPEIPGSDYTLSPGQQFTLNKSNSKTEIKTVDPLLYSAWIHGSFVFNDETIEQIFTKLGRWYSINVLYEDEEIRNERLTGTLPRFGDLGTILNMIHQVSDTEFDVKGNTITVK